MINNKEVNGRSRGKLIKTYQLWIIVVLLKNILVRTLGV